MKTNGDDHAYPMSATVAQKIIEGYGFSPEYLGLTKREHFAAMAMQGLLALRGDMRLEHTAESAVACADALIAELNKKA